MSIKKISSGSLQRLKRLPLLIFFISVFSAQLFATETLVVLIPDGFDSKDSRSMSWVDAANEEGLKLEFMTDSQFLRSDKKLSYAGFILPDQFHKRASETLIRELYAYVKQGGNLMLVYNAGVFLESSTENYYPFDPATRKGRPSRFSKLVGIDYVLYTELRGKVSELGPVVGAKEIFGELQVPPGKSMPYTGATSLRGDSVPVTVNDKNVTSPPLYGITGYGYGFLNYYSYVTRGEYSGKTLLTSPDSSLIAGVSSYGQGKVLFVNLPLTYLKGETDGMLMHGFLNYFGVKMLNMPRLSKQPQGRGGLILNWHVDDGRAIDTLTTLDKLGVWEQGPFSMHFTAGPDVNAFGDGIGMDVNNNDLAKKWIRKFLLRNYQIASHGGWIHNYYGGLANETNENEFKQYLLLNRDALQAVTQRKLTEYSAPLGNNPAWALSWLESQGVIAYYSAANTGLSQTRNYSKGKLSNPGMWAFPVSTLGSYATFEEFDVLGVTEAEMTNWYLALISFVVKNHTSSLIYFHPPGAVRHPAVLTSILENAKAYESSGQFEWYTMTRLAEFMNTREDVRWSIQKLSEYSVFNVIHPENLEDQTIILPKTSYAKPQITKGEAKIMESDNEWLVVATSGQILQFKVKQ